MLSLPRISLIFSVSPEFTASRRSSAASVSSLPHSSSALAASFIAAAVSFRLSAALAPPDSSESAKTSILSKTSESESFVSIIEVEISSIAGSISVVYFVFITSISARSESQMLRTSFAVDSAFLIFGIASEIMPEAFSIFVTTSSNCVLSLLTFVRRSVWSSGIASYSFCTFSLSVFSVAVIESRSVFKSCKSDTMVSTVMPFSESSAVIASIFAIAASYLLPISVSVDVISLPSFSSSFFASITSVEVSPMSSCALPAFATASAPRSDAVIATSASESHSRARLESVPASSVIVSPTVSKFVKNAPIYLFTSP